MEKTYNLITKMSFFAEHLSFSVLLRSKNVRLAYFI